MGRAAALRLHGERPLMTIRGASSVMEPPLLTVTDEGPTAVTAPPGVIST